ncbi:hypothetical protein [Nocardioides sp. SR21]|uniref:hypothetical protein n=1 Tax=Nocardioides sp. SR21 TaxID=2919501 RepID=UPI001FA97423|nr:hypothetical protein [Nocardioides sp. SR21]
MAEKLTRAAAALLLAGAAALLYAAAWERWWPGCRRGGFDDASCLPLQDHSYDYLVPGDPWTPVGQAAQLAGAGLLLLACAAMLLPRLVAPSLPGLVRWPLAAISAASLGLLGAATLLSGSTGDVVTVPFVGAAALVWVLAWPAGLTLCAGVEAVRSPGPRARWGLASAIAVGCSTPIPVLLMWGPIAAGGYVSYDTTPWSEATMAPVLLLAAGLVLWPSLRARRGPAAHRARRASGRASDPTAGRAAPPARSGSA